MKRVILSFVWAWAFAAFGDHGPGGPLVQGHCWLDDDPQFDAGQFDGGIVFGGSSLALREECAHAAQERWGSNGSSFVDSVQPVSGSGNMVQAECWLDDDSDFDFDQTSGGNLMGRSTAEIRRECSVMAKQRFGANSSSAIRNAKLITGSSGLVQGHCWLDDDPAFDEGQTDGGIVFGWSSLRLREECAWVATQRWGAQGSSFVKDIAPAPATATGVTAECWIDDDKDFDFDQTNGGTLFGRTTFDLRKECEYVAKQRFGEVSSSGIRNVKFTP